MYELVDKYLVFLAVSSLLFRGDIGGAIGAILLVPAFRLHARVREHTFAFIDKANLPQNTKIEVQLIVTFPDISLGWILLSSWSSWSWMSSVACVMTMLTSATVVPFFFCSFWSRPMIAKAGFALFAKWCLQCYICPCTTGACTSDPNEGFKNLRRNSLLSTSKRQTCFLARVTKPTK